MFARILIRFVLAVGLILQGGIGATAAYAASTHHCSMSHHDGEAPKCPCCPAKSLGMSCADACMAVAALPASPPAFQLDIAPTLHSIERPRCVSASIGTLLRPPIA